MKKLFSFLVVLFMAKSLYSQTENYKIAIENFQVKYNTEKYDEIFDTFSPEMKQALPFENAKQFLIGLKKEVGNIEDKEFIHYHQGNYAMYKTKFQKAVLAVNISLDHKNQINGLFIKPYEKPRETESKTVNALDQYPKEIAEIIFSKTKEFPNNTQVSIALVQNGKTNYYGVIKTNDTLKPIDNGTKIFEIGSITKVFTSTILTSLVRDKKIKLTDEINTYYPFAFKDNIKINFESLANHTSGLPRLPENLDLSNETNPYKNYGKSEIEAYLKDLLKIENGNTQTYTYSNLGAGLLGYTLGLSQKTSFQKLLQKRIFDKYKMTHSFTSSQNLENRLVKGLDTNGEIVANWDFDVLFGGGGILSTAEDLAKFVQAQFNPSNKELELTRKPSFSISKNMKIALGWHILKTENGEDLYWHNGGTGGYSSSMVMNVKQKTAVILLSNLSNINDKIDDLCFELAKKTNKK